MPTGDNLYYRQVALLLATLPHERLTQTHRPKHERDKTSGFCREVENGVVRINTCPTGKGTATIGRK